MKIKTLLAATALTLVAGSAQAAVLNLDVFISGTTSGADSGTTVGGGGIIQEL